MALSDIYQKASLVQIPSGYKSGTLYSVVPNNGDGDFTIDSSPLATRVNKDGLIESVAADQARLNYDFTNPQDPHLLLEPERTQLAGYPTAITSANGYSLTNGTLTANDSTAPDGSLTASTFEATSALGQFQKVKSGSSGVEYSVSVYVKRKTGTGTVYLRAVENTNTAVTVTDEWTRVSATVTSTSTNVRFGMALATSGDEILVWGFQVEAGSYPTSFIPNADNSEVTRTADTCGDAGNGTIIKAEGSLFVDFTTLNTDNFKRIYIISNSDFNNSIFIQLSGTSFAVQVVSGGTTVYSWGFAITLSDRHKLALRYKDGDSQLYYNGVQQTATTASGTWFSEGLLNKFTFSPSSFFNFYGEVKQAMVFNEALSDSELQTLTT